MKKRIMVLCALLVFIPIALAEGEMYIQSQFNTPNDIYGQFQFNANNVYLNIDGMDYQNSVQQLQQQISDSGFSMNYVFGRFYELWYRFDSVHNKWVAVGYDDLDDLNEVRARATFEQVFIPRQEAMQKINSLQFENMVLRSMFNESLLCEQRKKLAIQYGVNSIVCNGIEFTKMSNADKFYTIIPFNETLNNVSVNKSAKPKKANITESRLKGIDLAKQNVCEQAYKYNNTYNIELFGCADLFKH